MTIRLIYVFLLSLMLFVLYRAGKSLQVRHKIWSSAGIAAIITYTLNEGLRFGRGIDCVYGMVGYNDITLGYESKVYIGYYYLEYFLGSKLELSYQYLILILSFMFILGTLFLMKNYKEVLPIALPLFVLVSCSTVENLMKWWLAFSFVMIGLYYQISSGKKQPHPKFLFWSAISLLFHPATLPIPIIFYLLYRKDKPLMKPLWAIAFFFIVSFFFQSSFMQQFVDLVNSLSTLSERFSGYGDNAEYWLMKAPGGVLSGALPGIADTMCLCLMVYMGYKAVINAGKNYVFAYNLFLVGFLFFPIGRQIELVLRFVHPFMFFRAIVLAFIIKMIYQEKRVRLQPIFTIGALFVFLWWGASYFRTPFNKTPNKLLYVWDSKGITQETMIQVYLDDQYEKAKKLGTEIQSK